MIDAKLVKASRKLAERALSFRTSCEDLCLKNRDHLLLSSIEAKAREVLALMDEQQPCGHPIERKNEFIRQLAEFLVGDQAAKGIELQMGRKSAQQWALLRSKTPLSGYPTVDEAEKQLQEFLR